MEVDLIDLKVLVETMFRKDVEAVAQLKALTHPSREIDVEVAHQFAALVEQARPEAEKQVAPHYRHLRDALESGNNIADALGKFARPGRKRSSR